jgi:hypothetical protein
MSAMIAVVVAPIVVVAPAVTTAEVVVVIVDVAEGSRIIIVRAPTRALAVVRVPILLAARPMITRSRTIVGEIVAEPARLPLPRKEFSRRSASKGSVSVVVNMAIRPTAANAENTDICLTRSAILL